jgi:hypothetical protein
MPVLQVRKVKVAPWRHTRKVRGIAVLTLYLFARWGVGWSRHALSALPPRKSRGSDRRGGWVGPSAGLGGLVEVLPLGFEPCTFQPVASRCTDCYISWLPETRNEKSFMQQTLDAKKTRSQALVKKLHEVGARSETLPRKSLSRIAQQTGVSAPSARYATKLLRGLALWLATDIDHEAILNPGKWLM